LWRNDGGAGVNTRRHSLHCQTCTISSFLRRVPLRMRRVLPQWGQRAGGLTVCGTRWACASEVAIRRTMAALYHALGTSRILEGLMARWGFIEPREGIGLRPALRARRHAWQRVPRRMVH